VGPAFGPGLRVTAEWILAHPDEPTPWVSGGGLVRWRPALRERIRSLIGDPEGSHGCQLWQGNRDSQGYGRLGIAGRTLKVTRILYFLERGEWPPVMRHYVCDNPPCVRFDHLLPGTHADNAADKRGKHLTRGTHCPVGHEYAGDNLYVTPGGWWQCRRCKADAVARWRARQ